MTKLTTPIDANDDAESTFLNLERNIPQGIGVGPWVFEWHVPKFNGDTIRQRQSVFEEMSITIFYTVLNLVEFI